MFIFVLMVAQCKQEMKSFPLKRLRTQVRLIKSMMVTWWSPATQLAHLGTDDRMAAFDIVIALFVVPQSVASPDHLFQV